MQQSHLKKKYQLDSNRSNSAADEATTLLEEAQLKDPGTDARQAPSSSEAS